MLRRPKQRSDAMSLQTVSALCRVKKVKTKLARTMTPVPSQRPTRPTTTTSLAPSRTSAGVGARQRTSCSSHFASIFIPRIPFAGTTLDSRWAARRRRVIATGAGWATAWVRRRPYTVWRCSSEGHFRSSEAAQDFHSRAMDPVGRRQARQNQVRGRRRAVEGGGGPASPHRRIVRMPLAAHAAVESEA